MSKTESEQLCSMKKEIEAASDFIVHLIKTQRCLPLHPGQIAAFRSSLKEALGRHFLNHWFVDDPSRGCAYRCLQIHKSMDPILMDAAVACGFSLNDLRLILPRQFFMWVDPGEVSYRFGENGSICTLFDGKSSEGNDNEASCSTDDEQVSHQVENINNSSNNNNHKQGHFCQRSDGYPLVNY
ncbi:hypothetical protein B566_EDAN001172 [Ephemera danica]|nr:hypothetical protein B566_EDAN001172 [Ephemera danica]